MSFAFTLEYEDGSPAEPPTFSAAVPNWSPGDTIPLGNGRTLRVVEIRPGHGKPCPVSDLFGVSGRALLERLALPQPWAGTLAASLRLIDELDEVGRLRPARLAEQARAATCACRHPAYRERYQRTRARLGRQRGAKVAQVDLARRLAEAIWHMLSRNRPFAPAGATSPLTA